MKAIKKYDRDLNKDGSKRKKARLEKKQVRKEARKNKRDGMNMVVKLPKS